MNEPEWLTVDIVVDIHAAQLAIFGGPQGIRDFGLLESALDCPRNKFVYGETDLAALAAACAICICRKYPFVDGNKRAAFVALIVFLGLNDIDFIVPEPEAPAIILALAAGEVSEDSLARWIRDNPNAKQSTSSR